MVVVELVSAFMVELIVLSDEARATQGEGGCKPMACVSNVVRVSPLGEIDDRSSVLGLVVTGEGDLNLRIGSRIGRFWT